MTRMTRITRRSRNLGFGWTNQPEQTPGGLRIKAPTVDRTGLTPRIMLDLHRDAARLNNGNDWAWTLTVGGERITDRLTRDHVLSELRYLVDGYTNSIDL